MKNVVITEGVAKYLLAVLLDEDKLSPSSALHDYAQGALAEALFGENADFVAVEDASSLVLEALRSTVWA